MELEKGQVFDMMDTGSIPPIPDQQLMQDGLKWRRGGVPRGAVHVCYLALAGLIAVTWGTIEVRKSHERVDVFQLEQERWGKLDSVYGEIYSDSARKATADRAIRARDERRWMEKQRGKK